MQLLPGVADFVGEAAELGPPQREDAEDRVQGRSGVLDDAISLDADRVEHPPRPEKEVGGEKGRAAQGLHVVVRAAAVAAAPGRCRSAAPRGRGGGGGSVGAVGAIGAVGAVRIVGHDRGSVVPVGVEGSVQGRSGGASLAGGEGPVPLGGRRRPDPAAPPGPIVPLLLAVAL